MATEKPPQEGGGKERKKVDYEFLRRLYESCSEQPTNGFQDGFNLSELFERIEETRKKDRAFTEVVVKTGLASDKQSELEYACGYVSHAYELQGFINGFRLCEMLRGEMKSRPRRAALLAAWPEGGPQHGSKER